MSGQRTAGTPAWSYAGRRVALLTQHGKERVIAPVLDAALGVRVERVEGYDTDQLGTFTREIARAGTQLEAARRKAQIGMELAGLPFGLATEGSFGPDPVAGLLPWNVEMLVFIDRERAFEIAGVAQGPASFFSARVVDWGAAEAFARRAGFPEHHLVARPHVEDDPRIRKGIADWSELEAAFARARASGEWSCVYRIRRACPRQSDAHGANPRGRRRPGAPGFGLIERIPGLPCANCGAATHESRAEIHGCRQCAHCVMRERDDRLFADPGRCDACNP